MIIITSVYISQQCLD